MKKTSITELQQGLEANLLIHLKSLFHAPDFREMADYAVVPAGKLFRPLLAAGTHYDFLQQEFPPKIAPKSNLAYLCSFLEIHHAYTLVHDDLPCMDDDDERRGRPSHHKTYGEWQALLTGDALLIASFQLLSRIESPQTLTMIKLATWATGAKGLIFGQYLDLSAQMRSNFKTLIETHLLKTARLIQLSLTLPLIELGADMGAIKQRWKFGASLGILFQLLDDLGELTTAKLSLHEGEINPWLSFEAECLHHTLFHLKRASSYKDECGPETWGVISHYFAKSYQHIKEGCGVIKTHTGADIAEILLLLQRLSSL